MTEQEIDELARPIWNYMRLDHQLEEADCILVLGSHDTRVAKHGAELYLEGRAPWLAFSGGAGAITRSLWNRPEAKVFADIALEMGVPAEKILIEDRSTNSGENIVFTRQLIEQHGLNWNRFILVSKPYNERRAWATFMKQWPGQSVRASSPRIDYFAYPDASISKTEMINTMVGDLQRMKIYAEKGFQIEQAIPAEVWAAAEQLAAAGFNQRTL
ncbi:MAG: YdcF family protein [Acidobacteriota bacterium]|nr:MAG: YdcF family protein [Acidobacteriota bacterium]